MGVAKVVVVDVGRIIGVLGTFVVIVAGVRAGGELFMR